MTVPVAITRFFAWGDSRPRHLAALMVIAIGFLNTLLVFRYSAYSSYLGSDMLGYWERANQIYSGDEFNPNIWVANAPFYPRFLAQYFKYLNYLGLKNYFLEGILVLNLVFSTVGNFAFYEISQRMFGRWKPAMLLALFWSLSYPNLYRNAFVMAETVAVPLILIGIALAVSSALDQGRAKKSLVRYSSLTWAAVLMGLGIGARPSNQLIIIPVTLVLLFAPNSETAANLWQRIRPTRLKAVQTLVFFVAMLATLFTIAAENYRISGGKVRGLTAHVGYNFLLGQSETHRIISEWDGLSYTFVPASVASHPEYGVIRTTIPLYEADQFYKIGWEILKAHPQVLWDHVLEYKSLLFGNLFPAYPSVLGFSVFFEPFRFILLAMILSLGLLFIPLKNERNADYFIFLFGLIFGLGTATLFFFTITFQYFSNYYYSVYFLFGLVVTGCVRHYTKYRKVIRRYVSAIAAVALVFSTASYAQKFLISGKVAVTIEQNAQPIASLTQAKDILKTEHIRVDELEFWERPRLYHPTLGELNFSENFYITAETDFDARDERFYLFTIYADDGYRLSIDGQVVMGYDGPKTMLEFETRKRVPVNAGRHTLKIEHFQASGTSGLVGYYRPIVAGAPEGPYEYDTKFGQGKLIGQDDDYTTFHALPPD